MTETAQAEPVAAEPEYGLIDQTTPVGRRFEIEDGNKQYALTFNGMTDPGECGEIMYDFLGADGKHSIYTPEDWQEKFAPNCVGFTDPQQAEEAPVAEEPAQPQASNLTPGNSVSDDLISELRNANEDFHQALSDHEQANEIAKYKKKVMETAQMKLNEICDRITTMASPLPLFDKTKPAANDISVLGVEAEEDDWRSVRLDSLTDPVISDRYLKAMEENEPPIATMGELADWQKDKGDFWAKDIDGIGKKAQDEIAAATEAFWARRQHAQKQEASVADDKASCDGSYGWEDLVERIEEMLDDERYAFASETLQGIANWVFENEHCTEAQKQAVENIAASIEQ